MCEIMEKLTTDAKEEGRLEGRLEGIMEILFKLVADNTLSVPEAAERANMSVQKFSDLMAQR